MKRLLSIVIKIFIAVVSLPLLLYIFLIIANFSDEVKSDKVIEFESFLAKRSVIDDKSNGFVYAVGLSAPPEKDFYLVGVERIKQANKMAPLSNAIINNQGYLNIAKIKQQFEKIVVGCGKTIELNANCKTYLLEQIQTIDHLLAESELLIQRYKIMISRNGWYESVQGTPYNILNLSQWDTGHKIYMLHIWREAVKDNAKYVTQMLQQDSHFWRNTMLSTHSLLHFSTSVAMIEQNYRWGLFALNHLSNNDKFQTIPSDWHRSHMKPIFSFNKIVIGEWQFARFLFEEINDHDEWFAFLIKPIFNMQNTLNLHARMLQENSRLDNNTENALITSQCHKGLIFSMLHWYSYNPIGKLLVCSASPSFNTYQKKIVELEKERLTRVLQ